MVFCSSAWVAVTCVFTPPTSVETSAILALAAVADCFTSLISELTCCCTLACFGLDLAGQLLGVRDGFGLGLARQRARCCACARAASNSSFNVSRCRVCDAVVTEEASRMIAQLGHQRFLHLGHVGAQVIDLHVQVDIGGHQRDHGAGDQGGQQTGALRRAQADICRCWDSRNDTPFTSSLQYRWDPGRFRFHV